MTRIWLPGRLFGKPKDKLKFERTGLLVLLTALLGTAGGFAQIPSPTGNLYGTALDADGKLLPGVKVTLAGPGPEQTTNTDAKGDFRFLNLPPSSYTITLAAPGFETVRRGVVIALDRNAVLAVSMPVAGATEAVTVRGETVMDSRKTQTGANFSRAELDEIPTTRDPWAFLRQVPGVLLQTVDVGDSRISLPQTFVGKGSHASQNTFNLDGVGVSGAAGGLPINFDFDSLDSVSVATGGSDPSLSSPGVTLNLVTRRGTNQLRGSARALYTDGARWDYGLEAGGPLWKDRLWLWGSGGANAFPTDTYLVGDEMIPYHENQQFWNAKLSAQPVPSNSLTLSYIRWQRLSDGRGAQRGDRSLESTWDNTFPAQSYRIEDSQVASANLFASLYLTYLRADNLKTPKGGLDTQAVMDENSIWQNSIYEWDVRSTQRQAGATASAFFATGNLRHELKFGFGYRRVSRDSATVWPADQLFGNEPSALAAITRAGSRRFILDSYGVHLGDTATVDNLTVNIGARFDYQRSKNLASSTPANPTFSSLLPAVSYGGDSGYPITWRTIQPRVGATYALGKDRRTLLRASYARFADRLGLEATTISAFPGSDPGTAMLYYYWTDADGNRRVEPGEIDFESGLVDAKNVDPDNPASYFPINEISPDLMPPRTDEVIVAVERQISTVVSASLAYTHRSLTNPEFSPLIGTTRASYHYLGNAAGTAVDERTGFVLYFSEPYYGLLECPDPCVGVSLQNRPDAREAYDGVELEIVKRFSHGWMLRVGAAYNNWRQRIGPGAIVDPNNITPGVNASGAIVDSGINATWQFNVSGMVELPLGIRAGLNFFGRQGFPIPYFVDTEISWDPYWYAVPQLQIGRAEDYRTPDVYLLDLQVAKDLLIGSRVTVGPVLACFNVLNSRTVLARNGFVGRYDTQASAFEPAEQFNAVTETMSGRTFRVGVRVSF